MKTCRRIFHPVYEVYLCKTINNFYEVEDCNTVESFLFRVKLYLIFSEGRVYTFYNSSDWVDNFILMKECGSHASTFTHDIYVSRDSHYDMYKDIRHVFTSNSH